MPIPLGLVVGLGLPSLVGLGYVLDKKSKADAAAREAARKAGIYDECEAQRIALEHAAASGQPPAALQTIRINLAACVRKAGHNGVAVDGATLTLLPCQQQRLYLGRVFEDYKNTAPTDPIARDSKRGAMLQAGTEMVACLRGQLEAAVTRADVRVVQAEILGAMAESRARAVCYFEGGAGCGRYGVNEEHGNDRGMTEIERIGAPLGSEWFSGYGALGFGERFRAAANLQDRSRELAQGDYGGLRRMAEEKLARLPSDLTLAPGLATMLVPGRMLGLGSTVTLRGF